jgi:UDP-2,4-diacetamido-2,4,6-trideoxy-beta-L-altropyranose hydrolase
MTATEAAETMLVRADASVEIGTGHVMRCVALAQGWRDSGGEVCFAQAETTPALAKRLEIEGFDTLAIDFKAGSTGDARHTVELARARSSSWIVVDGYGFGAEYQNLLKHADMKVLLLDDYGQSPDYSAQYVLNQNFSADTRLYDRRALDTRLLLGPSYALLRREYKKWREWQREIPVAARKVLVTLGGSDPKNATANVIGALQGISDLDFEVKVLVGQSNPHVKALQTLCENRGSMRLLLAADDMPDLMSWADIAITGGGTTLWETAFMGLPSLVLVLAENQVASARACDEAGVCKSLGRVEGLTDKALVEELWRLAVDQTLRQEMSRRGRTLVDGLGCDRVIARLRSASVALRRAHEGDCRLIWEWTNDPGTRAVSFSSDPIPWDSHREWYASKQRDEHCFFYIATNANHLPLAQVRFDVDDREAVVSLNVAPEARGQGLGPALIVAGADRIFSDSEAQLLHAYIKPENFPSVQAFRKAGFTEEASGQVRGYNARHFTLERKCV